MVSESCIVCNNKGILISGSVRQVPDCKVYYCDTCDISFIEGTPLQRDEKQFYNEIYPQEINPLHQGDSPDFILKRRYKYSLKYLTSEKNDKCVLEVGSASGHFLNMVKNQVMSVTGCDLNSKHCEYAKEKYNIDCFNADILDIPHKNMYDVIFMFQLFEHIKDPHSFLGRIYELLKENGILILDIPNINEPLFRFYKLKPITDGFFFKIQHPFTYSVKGLRKIMSMHGFINQETRLVQNYSIVNHLNWIYKSKGNKSFLDGMSATFENMLNEDYKGIWETLNAKYKEMLVTRGFSDIIFAVFKKEQTNGES